MYNSLAPNYSRVSDPAKVFCCRVYRRDSRIESKGERMLLTPSKSARLFFPSAPPPPPCLGRFDRVLRRTVNSVEIISVITNDGRNIVGVLKGFDQATNIILDESHERVYSTKEGVQQLVLGLYIIRGDNISVVGELDEELDACLDLSKLKAHPLKPVIH
ncbi:hypothetical protein MLD38_030194 [Melastoma candidum]|uniref:Uncharacterized protein n=1 Tax=Melastoma candidum TaxID=119954 RepID=A0ACB9MMF2_9MYRT|nr:hypothetical protein MLD38_030194 [Melastoma candidum]